MRQLGRIGILLAALWASAGSPTWSQRREPPSAPPAGGPAGPSAASLNRKMLRASFEQLQKDIDQLVELATSLKEEVAKVDEDTLPLSGIKKAEDIEKLAKKIQGRMKNL